MTCPLREVFVLNGLLGAVQDFATEAVHIALKTFKKHDITKLPF